MASAGKLTQIWGRRWGNIGNEIGSTYTAKSEEQYVTTNQTYIALVASKLDFTTTIDNGVYFLQADLNQYLTPDNGNGSNAAFQWNGTLIVGTNGGSGDTWQRCGHGNTGNGGSWSMVRKFVYSPGVPAGTAVTVYAMVGQWGSVSSRNNYSGYSNYSDLSVMEFEPV